MARILRTQSDLMHVHRQILQSTDAERLAKAPQTSHAFENDSYVLFEPIDGPKDHLHTRRLAQTRFYLAIKMIRLVPFDLDLSRVNPQIVAVLKYQ